MSKPKIVIVEDDKSTIMLFTEAFKIAGFDAEFLDLGQKALQRFKDIREGKKEKPDLILLDMILPDMNGVDILKEARKYPETKSLKIFALTNYSDPSIKQKLIDGGIDKILIKTEHSLRELTKILKDNLK